MFDTSLLDLIAGGGYVVFILILCSVLSIKVIIEKLIVFKGITEKSISVFMDNIYSSLRSNDFQQVLNTCNSNSLNWFMVKIRMPLSKVIKYIIENTDETKDELESGAYLELNKEIARLEKGLGVLATLGSISPFIGLFGTVVGIIKSFNALSVSNLSNYTMVMSGIADALVATAAGLIVAVPAVMFYNYFMKRIKLSMPFFDEAIQKTIKLLNSVKGKKENEAVSS